MDPSQRHFLHLDNAEADVTADAHGNVGRAREATPTISGQMEAAAHAFGTISDF